MNTNACCESGCPRCPWRSSTATWYDRALAAGETLVIYAHDAALCECPPLPRGSLPRPVPLDCILIGRHEELGTDRCLGCGTVWTAKEYRDDPAAELYQLPDLAGGSS